MIWLPVLTAVVALGLAACGKPDDAEKPAAPEDKEVCVTSDDCELTCPDGATVASGERMRLCVQDDGTRHGPFASWSSEGTRHYLGEYADGQMNGRWREWAPDGHPVADIEYAMGVRHGKMILWHDTGMKYYEGSYDQGRPVGAHTYSTPGGTELERVALDANGTGKWVAVAWTQKGNTREEGTLAAGVRSGLWTSWDEQRIKSEFEYGDDLAGVFRVFHTSGTRAAEGRHTAGLPCGEVTCFTRGRVETVCTPSMLPKTCTLEDGRCACDEPGMSGTEASCDEGSGERCTTVDKSGVKGRGRYTYGAAVLGPARQGTPKAKLGRPEVSGSIKERVIRRFVERHKKELFYCYAKYLQKDYSLQGEITLGWIIDQEGGVTSAGVVTSSMNNPKVESCLERTIRHWQFPAPKRGEPVLVSYPIVFEVSK